MVALRVCSGRKANGQPCGAPPQLESAYCWAHDPAQAEAATEARRLGGQRRRRELVVAGAFEFAGLRSIPDLRRLLEVAVYDALGLENSLGRARTVAYLVQVAAKLLETGEMEERINTLEAAVLRRAAADASVFDQGEHGADDHWGANK